MFGRHSCMARATAICILRIVESFISYLPATKNNCRNPPKKFTIDIPSINPPRKLIDEYWVLAPMSRLATINIPSINTPRKLMDEYWFLAPMSRLAISSALLNIFFLKRSTTIFPLHGPSN